MDRRTAIERLQKEKPKVHCLTNPVTMQDVANILLAAGGSAIMAQDAAEAAEITTICHALYLNTGVPDAEKFRACILAGKQANELGHPVVLDPVGVGASTFRRKGMKELLEEVQITVIRCNQEEALTLLRMRKELVLRGVQAPVSGGVESAVSVETAEQQRIAVELAKAYQCVALVSGISDVVSDGTQSTVLSGGDDRIRRITGSGCMLSALCALFCGAGLPVFEAVCTAGAVWKESSREAGVRTDKAQGGIGSFHMHLFDALDEKCHEKNSPVEQNRVLSKKELCNREVKTGVRQNED